jgi:hypothetical protein
VSRLAHGCHLVSGCARRGASWSRLASWRSGRGAAASAARRHVFEAAERHHTAWPVPEPHHCCISLLLQQQGACGRAGAAERVCCQFEGELRPLPRRHLPQEGALGQGVGLWLHDSRMAKECRAERADFTKLAGKDHSNNQEINWRLEWAGGPQNSTFVPHVSSPCMGSLATDLTSFTSYSDCI